MEVGHYTLGQEVNEALCRTGKGQSDFQLRGNISDPFGALTKCMEKKSNSWGTGLDGIRKERLAGRNEFHMGFCRRQSRGISKSDERGCWVEGLEGGGGEAGRNKL